MIRLAAIGGLLLALLQPVSAQERLASVQLEDGRRLEGRVLSMNLKVLKIHVGNKILKVPASLIRSCRFEESNDPATQALREEGDGEAAGHSSVPPSVPPTVPEAATEQASAANQDPSPAAETKPTPEQGPAAAPAGETAPAKDAGAGGEAVADAGNETTEAQKPNITWTGPLQDPVDPSSFAAVPVDQRRSHFDRRVGKLDRAYPWLAPAAPSQWISLGVMLLVGLCLIVHMSVHVAGGEKSQLGRSMGFGIWYLITGLAQVAMVPVNDLSIVLMILLNSTLSLFGLVGLFGLPRSGAVVALMVQLGFVALVFGILELVTALLGSVGAAP